MRQVGGDDARLDRLYREAAVFAFPSRYEGFGLPPLEAMARGCPVAAAANSSRPAGNAAEVAFIASRASQATTLTEKARVARTLRSVSLAPEGANITWGGL